MHTWGRASRDGEANEPDRRQGGRAAGTPCPCSERKGMFVSTDQERDQRLGYAGVRCHTSFQDEKGLLEDFDYRKVEVRLRAILRTERAS